VETDMIRRNLLTFALALAVAAGLSQCAPSEQRRAVTVKGSDTMVILGQRWAEAFMASNPGTIIQVTGGGSGTGFAALINGTTDICQASRPIKEAEQEQLQQKFGARAEEIVVARDGLAVYVNADNPVEALTLAQVKDLYQGRVTNWKQVGGPDRPVILYGRENSSGTYAYFKEHVLEEGDFASTMQPLPGTAAVVNAVAKDANGVGFGGDAYAKAVRVVPLRPDAGAPAVSPTVETIDDGSYPLARGLFFYLRRAPEGNAKAFVDYCLGAAGQDLVTEVGYFPLRKAAE
jgi:phosphate transport system substrate-binding protein